MSLYLAFKQSNCRLNIAQIFQIKQIFSLLHTCISVYDDFIFFSYMPLIYFDHNLAIESSFLTIGWYLFFSRKCILIKEILHLYSCNLIDSNLTWNKKMRNDLIWRQHWRFCFRSKGFFFSMMYHVKIKD